MSDEALIRLSEEPFLLALVDAGMVRGRHSPGEAPSPLLMAPSTRRDWRNELRR